MKLKEKLLNLGCFEDNEYLDSYCKLIENNNLTIRIKYKTQRHHIIPKCYYRLNNKLIDDSKDNIVNLLYKDHILAHYYLTLSVNKNSLNLRYRLNNSFLHLIKCDSNNKIKLENIDISTFNEYQNIYEEWKKLNSLYNIGKPAWNKGLTKETDARVLKNSHKSKPFSEEHNKHNSESLKKYYSTHPGTMKGKHLTSEQKDKISKAKKGKTHRSKNPEVTSKKLSQNSIKYWKQHPERKLQLIKYNKERLLSKETHLKMSLNQPRRIQVIQKDLENNIIETFSSIRKACQATGIKSWRARNACQTGKPLKEGFYLLYDNLEDKKV